LLIIIDYTPTVSRSYRYAPKLIEVYIAEQGKTTERFHHCLEFVTGKLTHIMILKTMTLTFIHNAELSRVNGNRQYVMALPSHIGTFTGVGTMLH